MIMMTMTMITMKVLMENFTVKYSSRNQVTFIAGRKKVKNKSTNFNKCLKNAFDKFM
jgi:hypothetical protein